MGRVINTETAGKRRNQLNRGIVAAMRELMQQAEPNDLTRDLAAFIVIALFEIHEGVDISVQAWEKRGYWVKADRFRLDWEWTRQLGEQLKSALMAEDWGMYASLVTKIAVKLANVKVTPRSRIGTPWIGAWKLLQQSK